MISPLQYISNALGMIGISLYLAKVEFAAHVGWSIAFSLAGVLLEGIYGILLITSWCLFSIYDEFIIDGYKGKDQGYDTLWDLGSKILIPIGVICYLSLK